MDWRFVRHVGRDGNVQRRVLVKRDEDMNSLRKRQLRPLAYSRRRPLSVDHLFAVDRAWQLTDARPLRGKVRPPPAAA